MKEQNIRNANQINLMINGYVIPEENITNMSVQVINFTNGKAATDGHLYFTVTLPPEVVDSLQFPDDKKKNK